MVVVALQKLLLHVFDVHKRKDFLLIHMAYFHWRHISQGPPTQRTIHMSIAVADTSIVLTNLESRHHNGFNDIQLEGTNGQKLVW
jgi:hypothetical protein